MCALGEVVELPLHAGGVVFAADFSGDGHADILGVTADGNVRYYPNNNLAISDSTARQLATGWGTFTHAM